MDNISVHENLFSGTDSFTREMVRCPTCGLIQNWDVQCRRCGSDLTLLKRCADNWFALLQELCSDLNKEDFQSAHSVALKACCLVETPVLKQILDFIEESCICNNY